MKTVLVCAGDVSGDHHAAALVRALRERRPALRFVGLGGPALDAVGVELVARQSDLAVGGLVELVGSTGRLLRAWRALGEVLREAPPDLAVLVDSGGFNLPLARRLRRHSRARILYYVAPQVWAWRPGRIRKLARRVDRLAVIFPFEPEVYAGSGLPVDFVGHPLVDELAGLAARVDPAEARRRLGLPPERRHVLLLPGSRRNEITRQLPLQLEAARRLHARAPDLGFVLALAEPGQRETVQAWLQRALWPVSIPLHLEADRTHDAMLAADVALAKPGTVTVELMLLERPMVVMGRAHPLTAAVVRRAVRVPWLAMPNLVAGRAVVPELLQQDATPDALAGALYDLLSGPVREEQLAGLAEARARLGPGGAAQAASRIAEQMLGCS